MTSNKYTVLNHSYVYVVVEHAWESKGLFRGRPKKDGARPAKLQDAKVHGIFANRAEAEGKKASIEAKTQGNHGYLAVLKKPLRGKTVQHMYRNNNEFYENILVFKPEFQ